MPSAPPGGGARSAVALSATLLVVGNLPFFLVGGLAVQIRQSFGLDRRAIGATVAVMLAAAAVSSQGLGRFAQRVGGARGLATASLLVAASSVSVALLSASWPLLLAGLAVGGAGLTLCESSGNLLLAERVRPARRGAAFGIKQAAPPGALLLAGLALPAVALTVGWRWAYGLTGALAAAGALWARGVGSRGPVLAPRARPPRRRPQPALLVLALAASLAFGAAVCLSAFLIDHVVAAGMREGRAGLLLAAGSLLAVMVRLAIGFASDRFRSLLPAVAVMMVTGSAGFGLLAASLPWAMVTGALIGVGIGYGWSGLYFHAVTSVDPSSAASATGVVLTGSFVGSLVLPLLFGTIADRFGYSYAWLFGMGLLLGGAAAVLGGWRLLRQGAAA